MKTNRISIFILFLSTLFLISGAQDEDTPQYGTFSGQPDPAYANLPELRKFTPTTTTTTTSGTLTCDARTCCSYSCPTSVAGTSMYICAVESGSFPNCLDVLPAVPVATAASSCLRAGTQCTGCPAASIPCTTPCNTIPATQSVCDFRP